MKDLRLTITINRSLDNVFAFAINPENTPKWVDSIVTEQTNEWPARLGTIYRNQNTDGKWREFKVTVYEPDKRFVLSTKDGFDVDYTFTPIDANTTELEYSEWIDGGELEDLLTIDVLEKFKQVVEATHTHEDQSELSARLTEAAKQVEVGGRYMHYKQLSYTVTGLALREEDNEPCVIYQAEYDDKLTWIRPVSNWLEEVEVAGKKVQRFVKVKKP
jgi:hypothetical protein